MEPLRVEKSEVERYDWDKLSPYSFDRGIVKAECYKLLLELRKACDKFGLSFGLCKGDALRGCRAQTTLREVYKAGVVDLNNLEFEGYLSGDRLLTFPVPDKKLLRYHDTTRKFL